jgi:acyl-CoA thioester hydrolase
LYYGEKLDIRTFIGRIGGSSFEVYQELWQNGDRCASGTAVMVYFCYEQQSALKIPDHIKVTMQKHMFVANQTEV